MDDIFKVLIGVLIGLLLVGAAVVFAPSDAYDNSTTDVQDQSSSDGGILKIFNQNSTANTSTSVNTNTNTNANTNANSNGSSAQLSSGSGVTGGGAEYNGQAGGGYMYQINYSDGNFRQYDTKTGELIGSTFDEDQEKLGNINGEML